MRDDTISRQAAIDALKEHRALYCDNTPDTFSKLSYAEKSRVDELDTAIATLVNLPSAERRGRWMKQYGEHEGFGIRPFYRFCSECNEVTVFPYHYCPNCGAKMEEIDE